MGSHHKCADARAQVSSINALIFTNYGAGNIGGMNTIGSRVKLLRKGRHMTQEALAKALDITQPALSMIESGKTLSLSGEVLAGLCRELTTTPDFVLYGSGTVDDFESALQIAEVTSIMHKLPAQAREALLSQARLVARATILPPRAGEHMPVPNRREGDRRVSVEAAPELRRNQLLNPSRGTGKERRSA
jgi:transcriptional regulator with XRE-family HTH domain